MSRFDKTTPYLGFIYGNRDFFPDPLVTEARADLARLCKRAGVRAVQLGERDSKLGGVETHADARKCAVLFKRHVCRQGFEHHVVMTCSRTDPVLAEALGNYLGWQVYQHSSKPD